MKQLTEEKLFTESNPPVLVMSGQQDGEGPRVHTAEVALLLREVSLGLNPSSAY